MIEIIWHGRGGQGAFTASKMLGEAAMLDGKFALSFPSFGPERRGAPIVAYTKIDKFLITDRSIVKKGDYVIYLDESLFSDNSLTELKSGGTIFVNSKTPDKYKNKAGVVAFDMDTLSGQIINRSVSNTSMLALLAIRTGIVSIESVKLSLMDFLSEKVADMNKKLIDEIRRVASV